MGWLLAGGVLLVVFVLKGGRDRVAPQPSAANRQPREVPAQPAPGQPPAVPPAAPTAPEFTVMPPTSILAPSSPQAGDQVVLDPWEIAVVQAQSVPAELLGVLRAGGAASDQDLERAAARAVALGRQDIATYFQNRLDRRRQAERTTAVSVDTEPDHDPESGAPVERLEMVEREVPSSARPRGDRTVRQSVQTDALPTPTVDRNQLHALALRVADNLRRTGRRAYDRNLMKAFQRGAGLAADGDYGNRSRQALGYYGQIPAAQLPPSQY